MSTKPTKLGCDFHEPYFGASYPDACCIDGFLWDLDSCHEPGGPLYSGGDTPCPVCNHASWLSGFSDDFFMAGYVAAEQGEPFEYKHKAIRWEQPDDVAFIKQRWTEGYVEMKKDKAAEQEKAAREASK